MEKIVNIEPTTTITSIVPNISNNVIHFKMSTEDILKCIMAKAKVTEILEDNRLVALGLDNYDKDNSLKTIDEISQDDSIEEQEKTIETDEKEVIEVEEDFSGLTEEEIEEYKELLEEEKSE